MTKQIHNYIGCSGWNYKHWIGIFYPAKNQTRDFLRLYSKQFDTVEINTTFYGIPRESSVKKWSESVFDNFLFSVKASQYLTHRKKLNSPNRSLKTFLNSLNPLANKLGPILFQLPPNWNYNGERLESFLRLLRTMVKKRKIAIEFRNKTWYNPDLEKMLKKYQISLCFHDMPESSSPEWITSDFVYMRLHGVKGAYSGRYRKKYLKELAKKIVNWNNCGMQAFVYFNNDQKAAAPQDALELKKILSS